MKKIIILMISIILISGCGKKEEKILDKFDNRLSEIESYNLKGTMDISNDEDTFNYTIEVNYLKEDFYKVNLINNINQHEQIILKNNEGVYVITPSLNKSFKFQSDWPKSSSQSYLLNSILDDLLNDENIIYSKDGDEYIYQSSVDYPNNVQLKYQKVYFDKDSNIKKVEIYDENDIKKINVIINSIDYNNSIKESDFNIDNIITGDTTLEETNNTLEDITYPLYIPSNTYLTSKETIDVEDGKRVILTFSGEKNFVLVEEASVANPELEIIPVYGEPITVSDILGALGANSLYWSSNNIDYYLTCTDLNSSEIILIANSLNNTVMVGK